MMYVILAIPALAILAILIAKIKALLFKAKDAKLVKEDNALSQKQNAQELAVELSKAGLKTHVKLIMPEEVEEFWDKDKK